jgi:hypothetical protein
MWASEIRTIMRSTVFLGRNKWALDRTSGPGDAQYTELLSEMVTWKSFPEELHLIGAGREGIGQKTMTKGMAERTLKPQVLRNLRMVRLHPV